MIDEDAKAEPFAIVEPANGNVTPESEIKAMWRNSMLHAADDAKLLCILPSQGVVFARMRERLKLAEGACRQMAHWREDARWLYLAPQMERLHQMARMMIVNHHARPLFYTLETTLRKLVRDADRLENAATGVSGMILPKPQAVFREAGERPVQVKVADSV